ARAGAPDVERADHLAGVAPHRAAVEQAERGKRPAPEEPVAGLDRGDRDVELDRLVGEDADAAAVLGQEREPGLDRAARIAEGERSPVLAHRPARGVAAHEAVRVPDLAVASAARATVHL